MERLEAVVSGRVQMVWYRDYTRQAAKELGIVGEVRNQQDGTVYVIAEGTPEALEVLVERLQEGPPLAQVKEVKTRWLPSTGGHTTFVIADE